METIGERVKDSGGRGGGCGPSPDPRRPVQLAFKRKEKKEKLGFRVLKNPSLVRNGVVWSCHLLFIFKWGKFK